jgi:hypothetical protein
MLSLLRQDVDRLLRAGCSLEAIDGELIAVAPVDEDRRAALWLYAWLRSGGSAAAPAAPLALTG